MTSRDYVLCAGHQSRWAGGYPKQMAKINGQPLLERTLDMLHARHLLPIVVTHVDILKPDDGQFLHPERNQTTPDTILSTRQQWDGHGRIRFWCGDVYFTPPTMTRIVEYDGAFGVFTDTRDIFALSFAGSMTANVIGACNKAIADYPQTAKLWKLVKSMPPGQASMELVADETQDFDSVGNYRNFLAGHTKNLLLQRQLKAKQKTLSCRLAPLSLK
jgi:hypothetical protein